MTTEERLTAIEASLILVSSDGPRGPFYESHVDHEKIRWLIAEVRRLQTPANFGKTILDMIETHCPGDNLPIEDKSDYSLNAWLRMRAARDEALAEVERLKAACEKGKAIIHDIADGSEYRRGREDERRDVARAFLLGTLDVNSDYIGAIERGEHVAEQ